MKTKQERIEALEAEIKKLKEELNKPEFEVGKWYYCWQDYLIHYSGNELNNYGFCSGWRSDLLCSKNQPIQRPATDKEVEEALIKEAKRRGFKKGVRFECLYGWTNNKYSEWRNDEISFRYYEGGLWVYGINFYELCIFQEGKWAEIIKEEPLKVGGYLVEKSRTDVYSIGCKIISGNEIRQIKSFMNANKFNKVAFDGVEVDLETINKILNL